MRLKDGAHDAGGVRASNRSFGLVMCVFFLIVAFYPWFSSGVIRYWALLTALIFGLSAIFFPRVLRPLNTLWLSFGQLLHRIISPIVIGVMFVLTVVPTGLILKLLKKDVLHLKFDPAATSYWIKRDPPGPSKDSLTKQF